MNIVELYFNVADLDILHKIATKWKVNIRGFANLSKVPEFLLRKNLIQKFNGKIEMFNKLLEEIYGIKLKEMKIDSLDDFLYTFLSYPLKDKIPAHLVLGLLILLFPDFAEEKSEIMYDNYLNKRHLFEGCLEEIHLEKDNAKNVIEKLLQLKEPIEYFEMFETELEGLLKSLDQISNYENLKTTFKDFDFYNFAKYFIENRNKYPDYVLVLAYLSAKKDDIEKMSEDEKIFYNKLFVDAHVCLDIEANKNYDDKLSSLIERNNKLEKELNDKEERLLNIEREFKELENNYVSYKAGIEELVKTMQAEFEEKKQTKEKINNKENEFNPDFENTIVTNYGYDRIFDSIGRCNVISIEQIELFNEVSDYKGYVFIHRNSIVSTKVLLTIERKLKEKNIKFAIIFGINIEELTRNIIIKKISLEGWV